LAKENDLLAVGAPIVDAVLKVSHEELLSVTGEANGMVLVTRAEQEAIIGSCVGSPNYFMGGSASNTAAAVSRLGLRTSLLGKIGNDEHGRIFTQKAEDIALQTNLLRLSQTNDDTACCLCLITPDGERTMRTHLGAAANITKNDVSVADILSYRHIHFEGYTLFNLDYVTHIAELAKEHDITMSIDLASFEVVRYASPFLNDFLREYMEIVFANEDEVNEFGGEDILKSISPIVSLMRGANGAKIYYDRGKYHYNQFPYEAENIIDKVGAGDHFAGGFLYGYLRGFTPENASAVGTLLASNSIQYEGAEMPKEVWNRLKEDILSGKFIY